MTKLQALLAGEIPPGLYRYSSRAAAGQLSREAEQAGWRLFHVEGRSVGDQDAFLKAFAEALNFPNHFGMNWDAFEACLRDLSWLHPEQAKGFVIVYTAAGLYAKSQPEQWTAALAVLRNAVESWRQTATPMAIVLRGANKTADVEAL